jgi:hypothetical protein
VPALEQEIAELFLERLAGSKEVDAETLKRIRSLFSGKAKVKADDLVNAFLPKADGDVK